MFLRQGGIYYIKYYYSAHEEMRKPGGMRDAADARATGALLRGGMLAYSL